MSEAAVEVAPAPFQINGNTITETAVHLYVTARIRVAIEPTADPKEALEKALKRTDLNYSVRYAEYAEEITSVLVDQISGQYDGGDYEYESETHLTPDGDVEHHGVEKGQFIVIGTGNITEADSRVLDGFDPETAPVMVAKTGYGWIVSLRPGAESTEEATSLLLAAQLSEAFVTLWKGLRERGYGLMQLDRDADAHPDFQTFNW